MQLKENTFSLIYSKYVQEAINYVARAKIASPGSHNESNIISWSPVCIQYSPYSIGGRPLLFLIRSAIRKANSRACAPFNRGSQ
jgi:hypothetical protein